MKKKLSPFEKELAKLLKDEESFKNKYTEKNDSLLNRLLAAKVPAGLQNTLDAAFAKAFGLVFEKGTGIIERSYNRNKKEMDFKIAEFATQLSTDSKTLRRFSKNARSGKTLNTGLSGAAGMGMGFLGIGIPDIAVFTALLLKNIYETALSFGLEYDSDTERAFILKLISTAVCYGEEFERADRELDEIVKTGKFAMPADRDRLIKEAAGALSKDLLYMKFLQGIPIVGLVGGAYDAVFMQRRGTYAELKYRKRFYHNMKERTDA